MPTTMPGSDAGDNAQLHSTFYLSGQNIVFKVGGTLFKVDPVLFIDGEDSVLRTMLSLPQGDDPSHEGTNDANPIVLHDDTSTQFETLLWGLHSQKLFPARVSVDDVDRYVQLAKICHKYGMEGLETWATSGLARLVQANVSVRMAHPALLLDAFYLCGCTDVGNLMLKTVKEMLDAGSCSAADIATLINSGQRYSLPGLTSRGYYTMMLKPRSEWESEPEDIFSWNDRYRLLNGYYALSEYSLDESIKTLSMKFSEYHPSWGPSWSSYAVPSKEEKTRKSHRLKHVDIVARLRQLVGAFLRDRRPVSDIHATLFLDHLDRVVDDLFDTTFPRFFVDPTVRLCT